MSLILARAARQLRNLSYALRREKLERELTEEIASHRDLLERHEREQGSLDGPEPAKRLGNVTLAREQSLDAWTFAPLDSTGKDIKQAIRGLIRTPAFTVIAVASLALGIGANTAIFSFVDAILLKQLPVPEPDRLVRIAEANRDGTTSSKVLRMAALEELAKRDAAFDGVFGWFPKEISFSRGDSARWLTAELVTGQYFQTLQLIPSIGRFFNDEDVRAASANPVCVISFEFWQSEFGGNPAVLSQTIFLNWHPYRILGVTGRGFYGAALQRRSSLQIPATRIADFMPAFGEGTGVNWLKTLSWLSTMARLRPGTSNIDAQHRTEQLMQEIQNQGSPTRIPEKQPHLLLQNSSQGFNSDSTPTVVGANGSCRLGFACGLRQLSQPAAGQGAISCAGVRSTNVDRRIPFKTSPSTTDREPGYCNIRRSGRTAAFILDHPHTRGVSEHRQIDAVRHPSDTRWKCTRFLHHFNVRDCTSVRPAASLAFDSTQCSFRTQAGVASHGPPERGGAAETAGRLSNCFIAGCGFCRGPAHSDPANAGDYRSRLQPGSRGCTLY